MCVVPVDPSSGTPIMPPLQRQIEIDKYGPRGIKHKKVIDKFGPNPGFTLTLTLFNTLKDIEFYPKLHVYQEDELKDINSVDASKEEVFFLKAFSQWRKLLGAAAMSRQMSLVDVQGLTDRPDWQSRMKILNASIQQTLNEAAKFYEYLDQTLDKPHGAAEEAQADTQALETEK